MTVGDSLNLNLVFTIEFPPIFYPFFWLFNNFVFVHFLVYFVYLLLGGFGQTYMERFFLLITNS